MKKRTKDIIFWVAMALFMSAMLTGLICFEVQVQKNWDKYEKQVASEHRYINGGVYYNTPLK